VQPEWNVIMNDVEDLLREGMERATRDLRAPAGLIYRITRRRRRRLVLRSLAGGVAALAAAAAAMVAIVVPGLGTGPTADAASVVKRVTHALDVAQPGDIAQMTITTVTAAETGGVTTSTTTKEWSHSDQWRTITNSPAGTPVYDEGIGTASVYTLVSYRTRTWAREPLPLAAGGFSFGQQGCAMAGPIPLLFEAGLPRVGLYASSLPTTVARDLRTAISCGTLTAAGRQWVDGIDAIKLTSRAGSQISETIWVSPGTDLPVRVVVQAVPGAISILPRGEIVLRQTADITWLQPTPQNLTSLTVPIPAGFRQVPVANAEVPILPSIPGGPLKQSPTSICLRLGGPRCRGGRSPHNIGPKQSAKP
jgi:hypothetical protein